MEEQLWEQVAEKRALTLGDVKRFQRGERYKLVSIESYVYRDSLIEGAVEKGLIVENKRYNAFEFFRLTKKIDTYIHNSGVTGFHQLGWRILDIQARFRVVCDSYLWPLDEDDSIPCASCRSIASDNCLHGRTHYSSLPDEAFVASPWGVALVSYVDLFKFPDVVYRNGWLIADEKTLNRRLKQERLEKYFAACTIQQLWKKYTFWKKQFKVVMRELEALPNGQAFMEAKSDFEQRCSQC